MTEIIPLYNNVLLPYSTLYMNTDHVKEMLGHDPWVGEKMLLMPVKMQKEDNRYSEDDFYPIGVSAVVTEVNSQGYIALDTKYRVSVESMNITGSYYDADTVIRHPDKEDLDPAVEKKKLESLKKSLLEMTSSYQWGFAARGYITSFSNLNTMMTALNQWLRLSPDQKYALLEEDSRKKRAEAIEKIVYEFSEITNVTNEAASAQEEDNKKAYREAAIRKQMDYLQKELDEMHPENVTDVSKLEKKIAESGMNETARKEADRILSQMKSEGKNSPEYSNMYNYLDFMTSLPWKKEEMKPIDLNKAQAVLDEDHYGLKKVKDRILEQIAVMDLNQKQRGSILLFVGAPGTGKTSIGRSIAKALDRPYVRVALGGARDEADIRGHRRTYIGAMPGRIMDGIQKAGKSNPVMVLDEVDKLGTSYQGDPASALLEVLDPEQNNTFTDHYMNVPYDLSDVLFICTANTLDSIPQPLLDRMEVISFNGYTATEKYEIAKRHLIPNALKSCGIPEGKLKISDDALTVIVNDYTMEGGVRGLKKQIDNVCRSAAVRFAKGRKTSLTITPKNLKEYLEAKPMHHDHVTETRNPGIVTGLAWTAAGGEILFIESLFTKGSGKVIITGQLGDVMKESVQIAISLVKSMFPQKADLFNDHDLHIHVPEGAVKKDGPSAGITLTTALSSLVNDTPVPADIAMTGEVSLRGKVMPIGGLPEKLMAAARAGVKTVFIPEENKEDLKDVAEEVKQQLKIIPVSDVKDVLKGTGIIRKK